MEGDGDGGDLCPVRLRLTLPDRTGEVAGGHI